LSDFEMEEFWEFYQPIILPRFDFNFWGSVSPFTIPELFLSHFQLWLLLGVRIFWSD
jgi:hypothetical protein